MFSERYAKLFWSGLALNLWVSFVSTFLAAAFALWGALSIRKTFFAKKICNFIFSLNLPMPHLVVAVGMIFVFSQSGLLARFFTQIGFIASPSEFPILVKDKYGFGIILAYIWKEAAFFFIILMSVLQSLGENFEELAQSLGANKWQRFRYVIHRSWMCWSRKVHDHSIIPQNGFTVVWGGFPCKISRNKSEP